MEKAAHTKFERVYGDKGYLIVGVDEVGRGALAGPIAVGAAVFGSFQIGFDFRALEELGIKDSKMLTSKKREELNQTIRQRVLASSVEFSSVQEINKFGIVYAFEKAARKAVATVQEELNQKKPIFLLVDAFKVPYVKGVGQRRQLNIVKGDVQCLSIAAASIIAKVERDKYMAELAMSFKEYQWQKNKGYGTRDHIEAIQKFGSTPHHRDLFLRKIMG